jgi:carboxyl-terminal processing protease
VKLKRAVIKVQSVRWRTEGEVGYLRVGAFNEQTQPGVDNAIKEVKTKLGEKLKGYVIDLRNNPGGLLDQAVSVADTFLERGEIVSTRSRRIEDTQRYNARPGDQAMGKPLVVLINDGSASASEIVAGALQDHGRAVILGTKSFGKGSVQTIVPLGANNESAMRLTTARYYTPSGKSIQSTGIEPDIEVRPASVQRTQGPPLRRAEADLPGALTNDTTSETAPPPAGAVGAPSSAAEGGAARATQDTEDYQLARALDLLQGIAIYQRSSLN